MRLGKSLRRNWKKLVREGARHFGGEKEGCGSILDKDGQLVTEKRDVLKPWRGYFQDLFASVNQVVEPRRESSSSSEDEEEISIEEEARKVRKLKAGKSA